MLPALLEANKSMRDVGSPKPPKDCEDENAVLNAPNGAGIAEENAGGGDHMYGWLEP